MTDRIETVARALCEADGNDPDHPTFVVDDPREFDGGDIVYGADIGPKWKQYRRMAKRHIAAIEALGVPTLSISVDPE